MPSATKVSGIRPATRKDKLLILAIELSNHKDPVEIALAMLGLMVAIQGSLMMVPLSEEDRKVFESAAKGLACAFRGFVVEDLFLRMRDLGMMLLRLEETYLGGACLVFFTRYNWKHIFWWPTSQAWYKGEGFALGGLAWQLEHLPEQLMTRWEPEADTAKEGQCLAG